MVFKGCYIGFSSVLQTFYNRVSRVYEGVTRVLHGFHWCFNEVTRVTRGCHKCVTQVSQGCYTCVSMLLQE